MSVAASRDVVVLSDKEEEVPLRGRRRRDAELSGKTPEVQVPQSTEMPETAVERSTDPACTNVTFAIPLSTDCPSGSVDNGIAKVMLVRAGSVDRSTAVPGISVD